jgi:hypothetical protein
MNPDRYMRQRDSEMRSFRGTINSDTNGGGGNSVPFHQPDPTYASLDKPKRAMDDEDYVRY